MHLLYARCTVQTDSTNVLALTTSVLGFGSRHKSSSYLGHPDGGVLEALLRERDAHRVLALLALEEDGIPVEDT